MKRWSGALWGLLFIAGTAFGQVQVGRNVQIGGGTGGYGITDITGDVAATGPGSASSTVQGLRSHSLACGSLASGDVPVSEDGSTFTCAQLTLDQILPAFAITGFTCSTCGTVELGHTVASPTNFTASYSSLPASASISDGTHTTNLTTPFTSGSLAFSYSSSSIATTTFTLQAVAATTKTATQAINWQPRTFYGVGTGGATGATASGNNAVLSGATGTLGTWGLGTNTGTVSVSPSGQYIYFLLSTNGHSFTVNGFGTTFSVTTITFTNQNSVAVTMYLYQSPTSLTGTYSVGVS